MPVTRFSKKSFFDHDEWGNKNLFGFQRGINHRPLRPHRPFFDPFSLPEAIISKFFWTFLQPEGHNTTISQSGHNVTAETLGTLPSTPKTVIIARKHCRGWKFVFGRLFGREGCVLNTLSRDDFCRAFCPDFFILMASTSILKILKVYQMPKKSNGIKKWKLCPNCARQGQI